jgi:transposase InsO family protein
VRTGGDPGRGGVQKKSRWAAAHGAVKQDGELAGVSVSGLCRKLGISRQNYYARRKRRQRRQVDAELICGLVKQERQRQPRLGARKMRVLLAPELKQAGVQIGRDRLFEVLRGKDLLLKPRRSEHPPTTNSYHSLPVFRNLLKELTVNRPNQVWVGDVTYLRTEEGFMYLALLTDKMSRKIVGYHCGDSLESLGCQRALEMALQQLGPGERPIHHSDRGSQYCCHEYVQLAATRGLVMSMTESDHCAENALAERMNGILKSEYGLDQCFKSKALSRRAVDQAIHLYDTRRPHSALGYRFPAAVHTSFLPPAPPTCGLPGAWAPTRYDLSRELGFVRPAQVGAIPVADQPVEPLRGR